MKVLLIYPPKLNQYNYNKESSKTGLTLGLAYIAAFLNNHNNYADIINAPYQDVDSEYILRRIKEGHYDIIGISMSIQEDVPDGIELACKIKRIYPELIIFVGGHFATHESENILKNVKAVDIVVRGEGEMTTLNLINAIETGEPFRNVKGITYRDGEETVVNASAGLIEDLDVLPFPIEELNRSSGLEGDYATISAQRGCYGNCNFCSIVAFYGKSAIRRRTPRNVVEEIEQYYNKFGKRDFSFIDDDFIDSSDNSKKWVSEFCKELKGRQLKIRFNMVFRANDCKEEILKPLIEVGLYQVGIGVESFSENVLKRMNKKINLKHIIDAIKIIRDLGLKLVIGYIMFEPDMSFEDLYTNYIFLKMYGFFAPVHVYNYAKPYSGTPLRDKLLKEKRLLLNNWYEVGSYSFLDERVQMVFEQLMKVKQTLVEMEKIHREGKLVYNEYVFGFWKLEYQMRCVLSTYIYRIIEMDKEIEKMETSISISSLGNILKAVQAGDSLSSIDLGAEQTLKEVKMHKMDTILKKKGQKSNVE